MQKAHIKNECNVNFEEILRPIKKEESRIYRGVQSSENYDKISWCHSTGEKNNIEVLYSQRKCKEGDNVVPNVKTNDDEDSVWEQAVE